MTINNLIQPLTPTRTSSLTDWLSYWEGIHHTGIDLELERIRPVAMHLGVLSHQLQPKPHIVMVAGTNGKGSTTKTIASIYHAAAQRVGLYQSPHVYQFNERISLDQQPVVDAVLIAAFVQVEAARQACGLSLSFFEATTLAAFVVFAQAACDVWVLEVGLGGRLDAVNLLDADVAVITNIGLDHTDWLGDSIEQIAAEKAGIMRPHIPVIYGEVDVPLAIAQHAAALGCPLTVLGRDVIMDVAVPDDGHMPPVLYYAAAGCTLNIDTWHLAAPNIAMAITAVLKGALPITAIQLRMGIASARMLGRFDIRQVTQLSVGAQQWQGSRTVILDAAHNVHGMLFLKQLLIQHLRRLSDQGQSHIQLHLVWSMLADKDIHGVVSEIASMTTHWHVAPLGVPRAADLLTLTETLRPHKYTGYASITDALMGALTASAPQDLILVCGSFYTLQQALEAIEIYESK